jgi:hypothetical protein
MPFMRQCGENVVQLGRPQMTIWLMRIACWIPKATYSHSEYVILTVFPLQQWLYERSSLLRYTYISCHVGLLLLPVYLRQRSKLSLIFVFSYFIGGNNSLNTTFSRHYLRTGSGVQQAFIKGNGTIS